MDENKSDQTNQEILNRLGEGALSELGLDGLAQEEKVDFLVQLTEIVQARMSSRVLDLMSDEELAGFNQTLDEKGDEAASEYVLELFPNYEMMVLEEYRKLVNEIQAQQSEVLDIIEERQKEQTPESSATESTDEKPTTP